MSEQRPMCEICGAPMPTGEEMFKFHGYSGPCPKPPLPKPDPAVTPSLSPQDRADGRRLEQAQAIVDAIEKEAFSEWPDGWHREDAERIIASALLAADEDRERLQELISMREPTNWPCNWCGYGHSAAIDAGEERKLVQRAEAAEAALARERQAHATTRDENARLRAALKTFGHHRPPCPRRYSVTKDAVCLCGFAAALASPSSPEQEPSSSQ